MEQYSNLNVHGKIKQKTSQGTESDDVVLYPTLSNVASGKADKDLENIEIAGTRADGKTIVWDATNEQWEYGEAGKVDAVQINGTPIAGEGAQTKVANIPAATTSALGVVQVGSGLSVSSGTVSQASVTRNDGTDSATLSAGGSFAAVSNVSSSTTGHVTGQTVKTYTLPSTYPPSSHTHGNITNDGKIGQTAGKPVITSTNGALVAGSVTAPIAITNSSITHDTSGVVSSGNTLSKGSASKSVSVTVNEWGHVTSLSDQDIVITESQVTNLTTDLSTITGNISTINGKIPSAASSTNQLADKDFVNSSIGTSTANFLGTYNAVSDLGNTQATVDGWSGSDDTAAQALVAGQISSHLPSGTTVTKNDYVFVAVDQTPTGDAGEDWFWRFKYTGSAWAYEYTLNNSSFTADQWNTINSLVTNTSSPKVGVDVKDINAHLADTAIHVTASDKTTWNGKQNAITGAASSITSSNLTASRVLVSDANGKVAASSSVTTTELGYIDGVTENIQTQLDTKFDTIDQDSSGNYVSSVAVDGTDPTTIKVTRATLPTLSGGQAATTGKYVSGVTVSGHTVTVSQENLPTLSKGTTTGSGNVVSDISVSDHTITLTKGVTALTSHQTIKQDGITGATVNRFGTCSTAASTAAKTVNITSGTFSLEAGATVSVSFTNDNTANSPTLSVDSTTAKYIMIDGVSLSTTTGTAYLLKGTCTFVYDGTYWQFIGVNNAYHKEDTSGQHALALSSAGPSSQSGETGLDYYDRKLYYSRAGGLNVVNESNSATKAVIMSDNIYITNGTSSISMSLGGGFMGNLTGNVTGNCSGSAGSVAYTGITSNPFAATDVTLADM